MFQLARSIFSSTGFKQSSFMVIGNLASTSISAISLILISRFLGPDRYGLFSVAFSLYLLVTRLADLGLNMSVQKHLAQSFESDQSLTQQYLSLVTPIKIIFGMVICIGGWILGPLFDAHFFHTGNPLLIRFALIFSSISFFYDYILVIFQSIHQFGKAVLLPFIQSSAKLILVASLSINPHISIASIFGWYAVVPVFALIIGIVLLPSWIKIKTTVSPKARNQIMGMTKFTSIAVIAAAVGDNIDVLMIQHFLNEYQTGLFAAASRISLMMAIAAYFLGTVLNSRVARYQQKDNLTLYVLKASAFIICILVLGFALLPFAQILLTITAGNEYLLATTALKLLLYSSTLVLATAPLIAIFYALNQPSYFAISGILQTVILITANYFFIPIYGINGSGYARIVTRLIIFLYTMVSVYVSLKKNHQINLKEYLFHLKRIL